ncbi:hypothetical protein POM88_036298 [Heracleum sosnowskyi]|uniref:Pre-mRNA polyadenylation factor Fip1 domain-containing protein n=1 Tax=Heracleum sosnowskyi TaxID=360622 RepID=A0AAD8HN51_9APIA|nr:hypothetical protein POM88_036298 [Heracleum sosnowskyi]
MEEDGDDFGPLYSDTLKPCCSIKEPNFFNDQNPSIFHARSDLSVNAYKDLKEYEGFLLSECEVDGGFSKNECKVDDEFDDVIFDVEMEQKEVEFDKVDGGNEINVLGDMMDEENYDLQLECLSVDEEASESDESFDIIVEDKDLNDHNVGSGKKVFENKELGLLRNAVDWDDLDDLEPGEIAKMKTDLGIDVEARVGNSYQSFHKEATVGRSVFMSQTIEADSKAEQNQVNPVRNAEYNYGGTRFCYLPAHFRKAFNIEDNFSGYKPWKLPGVNLLDYFNFDLDEENWQNYCKQMASINCWFLEFETMHTDVVIILQKLLLQTSPPSKAVVSKSELLQSKNTPAQQIGEAIQVLTSHGERVACLPNHHRRECDSDAIIEIVFADSPEDTESFTEDLKDRALHDYNKRPTSIHKIINGDKILPFPLDGYFHQIYHEERTSHPVSTNYAQEGRQWTDFESMVIKKQDHISYQDWSMGLDHPKEKSEAEQGLHRALVKYDKVMPLYSNKVARKDNGGQTTAQNRLEDDCFLNSGETSWRQGDRNHKKSLKQPDESKPTASVYDNQEIMGNGFDNCRMRMEEASSQTYHQEKNNDNKLNKGSVVDKDSCRMRMEETLSLTDHQEGSNDSQLNKGNAVEEDNCKMRIEVTLSQTDHQEGNNDNKLNKGSVVDGTNCIMRIDETLSETDHQEGNNEKKLNQGSSADEDNCRMRIDDTFSRTEHQEGNNDKRLNKGSAFDEDSFRMTTEETLSETDHQEENNDNKLNKGSAVDEDSCRMIIEDTLTQAEYQEGNRDNKLNKGSAFDEDNFRMRIEETLSETDHQEENNDNKLNIGSVFDEDNCRMRTEETLSETDHQEEKNDIKLNMGRAFDEDNCRMRRGKTFSEKDHQEENNDIKLNKGSAFDEDNYRMRIEETFSDTDHQKGNDNQEGNNNNKLNKGSAFDEDNFRLRIEETLSETDHQEENNDNKLNMGRAFDEDNCRMRREKTFSETDHQEENNDIKLNKGSAFDEDNYRMRIEETFSDTDHQKGNDNQEGNNNNKLNKGSAFDEDNFRLRIEETLSETDHQEENNDNKLNMGRAFDEDNCRMRREKTFSEKDHQEENNDIKLNKGSAFDEDNYRMRIEEIFSDTDHQEGNDNQEGNNDNKCNKGIVVDKDNCRMRKKESFSETDHQEGNDDDKLNNVEEDCCRMRIEENLSQTNHQEENNDNKLNKGSVVDDDFNGEQLTEPIDNHGQEFPNDCNVAKNLGNDVIFDDQKNEAKSEENVDEVQGSPKDRESYGEENVDEVQGSPKDRESYGDEMKQLMSNIKAFMNEVDELMTETKANSEPKHLYGTCSKTEVENQLY